MKEPGYVQKSRKLIFGVPVSATAGITTVVKNAGNLSNNGVEMGINGTPIKTKSFTWNINFTYTQFKAIVEKLETGVTNIFLGGFTTPNVRLVVGDEYGQIYGNAYQRDATKGNKIIVGANGLPLITPGVQKIGNPNPKWVGGLTNTFSYKGLSMTVFLEYRKGGQIYSRNIADLQRNGVVKETAEFPRFDANGIETKEYLFDAVYANGQPNTTKVSAFDYWGNNGVFVAAEGFIFETTWFRVREASIDYVVPSSVLRKLPFEVHHSVYLAETFSCMHQIILILTPEQNALGVSNAQGLEFNALPQTRTIGVGLKLSF
ncbi:MAG: hypothetical protein IPO68_01855 [Chitinophagaceae bacterium]|nr:hypothetical protein [Chitinophagaceae bacterium]